MIGWVVWFLQNAWIWTLHIQSNSEIQTPLKISIFRPRNQSVFQRKNCWKIQSIIIYSHSCIDHAAVQTAPSSTIVVGEEAKNLWKNLSSGRKLNDQQEEPSHRIASGVRWLIVANLSVCNFVATETNNTHFRWVMAQRLSQIGSRKMWNFTTTCGGLLKTCGQGRITGFEVFCRSCFEVLAKNNYPNIYIWP